MLNKFVETYDVRNIRIRDAIVLLFALAHVAGGRTNASPERLINDAKDLADEYLRS